MLHRSLESVYDAIREFNVAEDAEGNVVGCVALDVFWADLAEIKSLAVLPAKRGAGIGSKLVAAAVKDARRLGVRRVFTLTYEKQFFRNHCFRVVSREKLPDKVWRECIGCPKEEACDEIAMIINLDPAGRRSSAAVAGRGRGRKPSAKAVSRQHGGR